MPRDLRLREAIRPLGEALLPASVLYQQRAIRSALNADGSLREGVISTALPWQVRDLYVPGVIAAGANTLRMLFPQGGKILHAGLSARVAPTSAALILRLTAEDQTESLSLQAGEAVGTSGLSLRVQSGEWLTVSVLSAGGTEDLLISLHYTT